MAFNMSSTKKSSSLFKKSTPPDASAYLSALSQADARARRNQGSPTSTPALSTSSSITSSSEDTVLHESDDNADGLALPPVPPTSEQAFNTVHTEFGHSANEQHRLVSKHPVGQPLEEMVEQDPPYYILLSTYICYILLIIIGHLRDFFGKRLRPAAYKHLMPANV
jgi:serine palmitoyltransferase